MEITGEVLRSVRASLGVTQAVLADRLGVSPRTVGHWEAHGVPAHRVPLVTRKYAASVAAARAAVEHSHYLASPEGRPEAERLARVEARAEGIEQKLRALVEASKAEPSSAYGAAALRGYTSEQLMAELLRRIGQ